MKRMLLATLALLACQMPVGAKEEACLQDRSLLEGTFVLVKSIPAVSIGESELDGTVFLDGQKISIAYHEGSCESWPSIQSRVSNYEMLFHPPFANEMCRQHPWEHWCDSERQKIPQKLIQRNMKVTVYDADEIEWKEVTRLLEPYGFVPGKKNYIDFRNWLGRDFALHEIAEDLDLAVSAAVWYWQANELASLASVEKVTIRINGGTNGLADRVALYRKLLCSTLAQDFRASYRHPSG